MLKYLKFLISPLLEEPAGLEITQHENAITIKVADSDTGRVIGKHGSIIHSLRVLAKTYAINHNLGQSTIILNTPEKPVEPSI